MDKIVENKKPEVKLGEWILIGENYPYVNAVVCKVYEDQFFGDLEIVYMNDSKAINEDVIWDKNYWKFKSSSLGGGYADKYSRLSEFVQILRSGRRF